MLLHDLVCRPDSRHWQVIYPTIAIMPLHSCTHISHTRVPILYLAALPRIHIHTYICCRYTIYTCAWAERTQDDDLDIDPEFILLRRIYIADMIYGSISGHVFARSRGAKPWQGGGGGGAFLTDSFSSRPLLRGQLRPSFPPFSLLPSFPMRWVRAVRVG
jgi:hypothetical protein